MTKGISVQRGAKKFERIRVIKEMGNGSDLAIPVHILGGARSGPTLCLVASCGHGNEGTFVVDALKHIMENTNAEDLSGAVIAIPVTNPNAFEMGTRYTPTDFFFTMGPSLDMNRVFPGNPDGNLSQRQAWAISENIIRKIKIDCIIDLHAERFRGNMRWMFFIPGLKTSDRARELAHIFGLDIHLFAANGVRLGGTLTAYADTLGIPTVIPEFGTEVYNIKENIETAVRGIQNVMKYLGMIKGDPIMPKKQFMIKNEDVTQFRASNAGLFRPESGTHGLELTGTIVKDRKKTLARIISPYTFEELERFETPYQENLILSSLGWGPVVPGQEAYRIGNMEKAVWIRQ